MTRQRARANGGSTRFPVQESLGTKAGKEIPGESAARQRGSLAPTIPATNTTFWTTGNPSPSNRGEGRAGDNLYSNSLLALDPDTGKLKWHFQFTQHDEHDYDATQVPVMIDDGDRKWIAQANRNGFFYVVDRTNGKLISATSYYAQVSWSTSKDATGRPVPDKAGAPTAGREPRVPWRARGDELDVADV